MRELAERGQFIFTIEEAQQIAEEIGISERYLPQLLSDLAAGQWLQRLRRGLYAGTGGLPGDIRIHPFAISARLVSPSAISHWSALHHHGLIDQVPFTVTASTPRKVVTPSMRRTAAVKPAKAQGKHAWEIDGVRYEYVTVTEDRFLGIAEEWVDSRFKTPIYDAERSLLDGFAMPRYFGGLGEALGILEEHAAELNLKKLVEYAIRYNKATVAKRLGWALDRIGAPVRLTAPLAALPMNGVRVLDPTRPRGGECDKRWQVEVNNFAGDRQ